MSLEYQVPVERFGAVYDKVLPHDFNPIVSDAEARRELVARLEVEQRISFDRFKLDKLKEGHPLYAEASRDWLSYEKKKLIASGVEITDEMLAEAEILDGIITEVQADEEDPELITYLALMKDLRVAQHELSEFQTHSSIAA